MEPGFFNGDCQRQEAYTNLHHGVETMGKAPRTWHAVGLVVLLALSVLPLSSMDLSNASGEPNELSNAPTVLETVIDDTSFATTDGFTHTNLTTSSVTGITTLQRPAVSWTTPTNGNGLSTLRTGTCSVYLPSTDEVYLMGGRSDANPVQTGDEAPSKTVDIFDMSTMGWSPAAEEMASTQQYHGCGVLNGVIYTVGDLYPNSQPAMQSTGMVQKYDPNVGNWTTGTSMPSGKGVGLAGVAVLNNQLYVAGGVAKPDRSDLRAEMFRYDPINDQWTQLANMTVPRHSFELVPFRGKLIAYGGVGTFFDPAANQTVTGDTNRTEAYDPVTNSWSPLPNATRALTAYAAEVFNDEIVIHGGYTTSGWSGTASDKTYGYDPFVNRWRTHATLPIGMYDSTLVRANDTLVYAGGDMSNQRFSTWSVSYLGENEYFTNPDQRMGWLTSSIERLSNTTEGSASLTWLDLQTVEPSGTTVGLQYRTAAEATGIASAPWKPTVVPVHAFLSAGNHSMDDTPLDHGYVQYRARLTTASLMDWDTPSLARVTIGADEASFITALPATMQPTSAPINITTHHHASTATGDYVLGLRAQNPLGGPHSPSEWTRMTWNTSTQTLDISDNDGLIFETNVTAVLGPMTASGQTVTWSFSLASELPSEHLRFMVQTQAARNVTYIHEDLIGLDREVEVVILGVTADASSVGGPDVETGEVLPGNAALTVRLQHRFANSGLALMGGSIEARIHTDVLTHSESPTGERIWENSTTNWFMLPTGGAAWDAVLNLPESIAGDVTLSLEVRTAEDWTLQDDLETFSFVLNGVAPVLVAAEPTDGAYVNEARERPVTLAFNDVGGFTQDTVTLFQWIEAVHDGTNGGSTDGLPQRSEYAEATLYINNEGNRWYLNTSVNDTMNADHQTVHLLLEGTDAAGYALPAAPDNRGHLTWTSRTPSKTNLTSLAPVGELVSSGVLRLEPTRTFGWSLTLEDTNDIADLLSVKVQLGGDDRLGFAYNPVDGSCSALDQRILVLPDGCQAVTSGNTLTLNLTGRVDWSFAPGELQLGRLDAVVRDVDGTALFSHEGTWGLQRELSIDVTSLTDEDGPVTQPLTEGVAVMSGDDLVLRGIVTHRLSETPYTGELRLRWDGLQQSSPWRGAVTVSVENGSLDAVVPTPTGSGLMHEIEFSLWDPYELTSLTSMDVPAFRLDGLPPELLASNGASSISRYHLDEVNVGVNVREAQGWNSNLTVTCQVRSLDTTWPSQTQSRNATTVFDGNTMFSFQFNMTGLGDPSTLPAQASIGCWADGRDDAGWSLVSSTGNSEAEPWLMVPLNNIGPDLTLQDVVVKADVAPGENVDVTLLVVNSGEALDTGFDIRLELVQGDSVTLVGRAVLDSLNPNTAVPLARSFEAPDGTWTLQITVDHEAVIWEVDEGNNAWNATYTTEAGGFGGVAAAAGGAGALMLVAVVLLRRRQDDGSVDEAALKAAMEPVPVEPASPAEAAPAPKPRGPPGGKIAGASTAKPSKGPPRGPPRALPTEPTLDTKAMAAAHFDALGSGPQGTPEEEHHVADYTQLPGGGDYEYTDEGTFYVLPEGGERWRLNEDKSFTKVKP